MNPDIVNTINHAAAQSDRWLFLASLALLLLSSALAVRWLVGEFRSLTEKMTAVVQSNTDAMYEVRTVLSDCKARTLDRK